MPITSKRTSAEDADNYDDEIMTDVKPDAEQRARMRAGPRDRKPEPDFKDEGFAASVYQKFNSKPKSDESPKREAAEDE
jgi:hypothetical protein